MERPGRAVMRLITLPTGLTIALDIVLWALIHMGISALATRLPGPAFNVTGMLFRPRRWERGGAAYQTLFRVKSWKAALPDAAPWFRGGFPKKRLLNRAPSYISRFIVETARGEAAHWAIILVSPLFFLWNPVWVGWVMVAFAVLANLPCIIVQRYNRGRLIEVKQRQPADSPHPAAVQ